MALLGTLQVRLGLDTATFGAKFGSFTKDLEKRAKGISKGLSGLTNFGSLVGGAGIGATLAQGITVAGDFETTINQVAAAAELGDNAIAGLSKQALDLSKSFKVFSPQQVADGMLELTKAGITPAQQEAGALAETMRLAATEGLALGRAAEVMAEQMGAFGLSAKDSASIADALAGASIASTASVESLAQGLSQSAKVANLFGSDINDTAGALALFASNGLKGSDAGTSLKTMFSRLIPSTDEATAEMKKFGIEFTTADGKIKDITEVADILRKKLGGLSQAQRNSTLQTIFGSDAIRAAAILTESGAEKLQTYIDATKDKEAAERLSEARTKGYRGAIDGLKASFQRIAIELANGGFLKGLTDLANKGSELLGKLSGLPQWAKNLGIGLAVAAAAAPPLALALSSLVLAGPALLTGLGAITAFLVGPWGLALVAATAAFVLFKDDVASWAQKNPEDLAGVSNAWNDLGDTFKGLGEEFSTSIKQMAADLDLFQQKQAASRDSSQNDSRIIANSWDEAFSGIAAALQFALEGIKWFVQAVANDLKSFVQFGRDTATSWMEIWERIPDDISNMWADVKASFNESAAAIKELWQNYSWSDLGKAIIDGIVLGIKNGAAAVAEAAKEMAQSTFQAAKDILGIQSPSKVFEEVGTNVGQGFINGIASMVGKAGKAIKDLVSPGGTMGFAPRAIDLNQKTGMPLVSEMKKGAIQVESAWTASLQTIGSAIDEFVKTGKLDFGSLVKSIIADIASAALKNAFNSLFQGVAGLFSGTSGSATGGSSTGWIGSILKAFGSFEGGGYTGTGPRTGGMDGRGGRLAMLHPQETVIDHAKVRGRSGGARRPAVNLSVPITLMPGVSRDELARLMPLIKKDIIQTIPALIARGGRYASGFGQ